jgi:hypothetical protein
MFKDDTSHIHTHTHTHTQTLEMGCLSFINKTFLHSIIKKSRYLIKLIIIPIQNFIHRKSQLHKPLLIMRRIYFIGISNIIKLSILKKIFLQ